MLPATSYPVPALEKGLDLLEFLAAQRVPQSLNDLARGLGRGPSEIFRMLNCLERRGYIGRDDGRYRLTLKLFSLAHAHSPVEQILRAAERPMRDLARELRESVHLSLLTGDVLLVLAQVESPEPRRLSVEVGGRFAPLETCSGRLLLAYDESFSTSDAALARRLAEIRRRGVSVAESESIQGVRDVAVLVGPPRARAALCVPSLGLRGRRSARAVEIALKRAARRVNKSLGLE